MVKILVSEKRFNTQPPEGGWPLMVGHRRILINVSTHSRLKAAGFGCPFVG